MGCGSPGRLKAGTVELMPVVKTLRLGALDDWKPGWVRKVWDPMPAVLQSDGTMFGGCAVTAAHQRRGEFRNPSGDLIAKAAAQQVVMPIPERLRGPQTG